MTRRLNTLCALMALTLALSASTAHAAMTPFAPTPPDAPCDFAHRMDVAVINGVWFECSCEALMIGTVCDWYEITSAAPEAVRLDLRRYVRSPKRIVRIKRGFLYVPRVRPAVIA